MSGLSGLQLAIIGTQIDELRDVWHTSGVSRSGEMEYISVFEVDDSESPSTEVLDIYSDGDVILADGYDKSLMTILPILNIVESVSAMPSVGASERTGETDG